jgi:hypothetical protein
MTQLDNRNLRIRLKNWRRWDVRSKREIFFSITIGKYKPSFNPKLRETVPSRFKDPRFQLSGVWVGVKALTAISNEQSPSLRRWPFIFVQGDKRTQSSSLASKACHKLWHTKIKMPPPSRPETPAEVQVKEAQQGVPRYGCRMPSFPAFSLAPSC